MKTTITRLEDDLVEIRFEKSLALLDLAPGMRVLLGEREFIEILPDRSAAARDKPGFVSVRCNPADWEEYLRQFGKPKCRREQFIKEFREALEAAQ
jgi:hypothetical protein